MPRYAKKGTTVADIGQKLFDLLVAARRQYSFGELERESGCELKCFDDIPADVAADHFWDYALHEFGYSNTKARKDLAYDMPEAVAMVVLPQLIKDKLVLHTSRISIETIEHINKYNNVADIFRDFVWPAIENNLRNSIEGKKAAIKTDHFYCIVEQTSGSMSMREPDMKYLGPYYDKMYGIFEKFMEDYKPKCKKENKYFRPDEWGDPFDTWEELLDDMIGTLAEQGKLIISFQEWDEDSDPGYFCIYAKGLGNES